MNIPGLDVNFVSNLTDGPVCASEYNAICKSLRETETRIASGGPLHPVPKNNGELLERALAIQTTGTRVAGLTFDVVHQLETNRLP